MDKAIHTAINSIKADKIKQLNSVHEIRTTKQQIMHAHGRRKQHSNKTRKTREQK